MKYSRRVEIFRRVKADYAGFLTLVLWKLTGDRELFYEALQYAMLGMWKNVEKLNGKKAGAYIYRIALSANSKSAETAKSVNRRSAARKTPLRKSAAANWRR